MTDPDVIARLRELVAQHGSIAAAARAIGLHRNTLGNVLRGDCGPGPTVYAALGIVPPIELLPIDPGSKGMRRLRAYVRRHGVIIRAAKALGVGRVYLGLVLNGGKPMGPKLYRALGMEPPRRPRYRHRPTPALDRRIEDARELKKQSWERGRYAIPKAKLAEIR